MLNELKCARVEIFLNVDVIMFITLMMISHRECKVERFNSMCVCECVCI